MGTMKRIAVGITATVVGAGAALTAAPASSAAPVPHWSPLGEVSWIPPAGHCQGGIATRMDTLPDPSMMRVTLSPVGTWGAAPGCDVTMQVGRQNGVPPFIHRDLVTVAGGPTSIDVRTGHGFSMLGIMAIGPVGLPVGGYVWM